MIYCYFFIKVDKFILLPQIFNPLYHIVMNKLYDDLWFYGLIIGLRL
jgi:hypothetical protein